jgi:hypothetical protein
VYNLCYKPINYVGTRALKKPEVTAAAAATEAAASGGCCYGGVGYEGGGDEGANRDGVIQKKAVSHQHTRDKV